MEVDFLTGHALLLIEYRDHAYHILFANQKSRELFWQGDVEKCKKWEEAFNTYNQPAVRYLRRGLRRVMLSGEDEELAYPLDGDFIMMDCHRVIAYNGRCLLSVNCRLHKVAHEGDLFRPAYLLRNLFYLYDKVATFNLAKNEAIELTQPQLRSGLRKARSMRRCGNTASRRSTMRTASALRNSSMSRPSQSAWRPQSSAASSKPSVRRARTVL